MKALFLSVLLTYVLAGFSTTYHWKGTISSDYQNAGNWNPIRLKTSFSDTLIFSIDGVVQNVKNEIINAIVINASTEFWGENESKLQTEYLLISSIGNLILSGEYAIKLSVQKRGLIQGKFTLDSKSVDLNHRLLGVHARSIVFEQSSVCQVNNLNGNLFGRSGVKEVVVFKNEATYWTKDGGNPFGFSAPYSKVIFSPQSIYIHEHGYAPSLGGRTYGEFVLNYKSNILVNFGSDYSTTVHRLVIQKGNISVGTKANEKALDFEIKELEVYPEASFSYNPSFASIMKLYSSRLPQNCSFGKNVTLQVFSDTLHLQENLNIEGKIELNGVLNTNGHELVIKNMAENAIVRNSGFVKGTCTRYVNANNTYIFPVGIENIQTATITTSELEGVKFITCDFVKTNLPFTSIEGIENVESFLDHGYWKIEPNQQPIQGTYSIQLTAQNYTNILTGKELRIVKRTDETEPWQHKGTYQSVVKDNQQVNIQYNEYTSFSHFAIVEGDGIILPLVLKKFEVREENERYIFDWEMYDEEEGTYQIKVSENGIHYETLIELSVSYDLVYKQYHPKIKANYFQLCHNNQVLETKYQKSEIQATISPNPSQFQSYLSFEEEFTGQVTIYDFIGKQHFSKELVKVQEFILPLLPKGIYLVKYNTSIEQWIVE